MDWQARAAHRCTGRWIVRAIVIAIQLAVLLSIAGCTATVRVPGEVRLQGRVAPYSHCHEYRGWHGRRYVECD